MPLQLRSQVSSPRYPTSFQLQSPPKRPTPRLLPLALPAYHPVPHKHTPQCRFFFLLFSSLILLCIPLAHRVTSNNPPNALHLITSQNASDFNYSQITSQQENVNTPFVPRPRTVLVVPARGGVGNQLYFIAEALFLARHANLDLVIPPIGPRHFAPDSDLNTREESGKNYWNTQVMSRALAPNGRVLDSLPDACQARFDAVYVATRTLHPKPEARQVSSRAKLSACFLIKDHDWGQHGAPFTRKQCPEHVFNHSFVQLRTLPQANPPDRFFLDELESLQDSRVLPGGRKDPGRPACVVVDGHAFNLRGKEALEYLYSFLHYVEPIPRITDMLGNWTLTNLAVLHLRHDELACKMNSTMVGHLCIRVSLQRYTEDSLYWAKVTELAEAVLKVMKAEKVKFLYIASSPYMPAASLNLFRDALGDRVRIAQKVNAGLDHNDQNFVERELAIRAKVFIGEFSSTWSGTVYFKRRILSKKTYWTNVLLGKDDEGLGYYRPEDPLPLPEFFEARGVGYER